MADIIDKLKELEALRQAWKKADDSQERGNDDSAIAFQLAKYQLLGVVCNTDFSALADEVARLRANQITIQE